VRLISSRHAVTRSDNAKCASLRVRHHKCMSSATLITAFGQHEPAGEGSDQAADRFVVMAIKTAKIDGAHRPAGRGSGSSILAPREGVLEGPDRRVSQILRSPMTRPPKYDFAKLRHPVASKATRPTPLSAPDSIARDHPTVRGATELQQYQKDQADPPWPHAHARPRIELLRNLA
jgi:hypothetical protein